jgi:hypothetical protein
VNVRVSLPLTFILKLGQRAENAAWQRKRRREEDGVNYKGNNNINYAVPTV